MDSQFLHMTSSVDFSVVRTVISALEDFRRYFMTSKADDVS